LALHLQIPGPRSAPHRRRAREGGERAAGLTRRGASKKNVVILSGVPPRAKAGRNGVEGPPISLLLCHLSNVPKSCGLRAIKEKEGCWRSLYVRFAGWSLSARAGEAGR